MTQEGRPGEAPPTSEEPEAGSEAGGQPVSHVIQSFGVNAELVDEIRHRYDVDPDSVHPSWAELFEGESEAAAGVAPAPETVPVAPAPAAAPAPVELDPLAAERHAKILRLIHSFRARGHRVAHTNPLGGDPTYFPELDPAHYGFGDADLDQPCIAGDLPGGPVQTLRQILERLRATYCRCVGYEYTHIQDPGRKQWLQQRIESSVQAEERPEERLRVLEKLSAAALFERFLHTKFVGQKRFSLEGAESLIPMLDEIVERAPEEGVVEIVLGMAHRGRLNVMSNVLGRSLASLFSEFEDVPAPESPMGSGDVKYHKGFSSDRITRRGDPVHLSLTANPSHLEAVNPVVEGRVRAKQVRAGDGDGSTVLPVLVHGDAAFAGQGIVAETLNLSKLGGYSTGGTLHVVVNNQIGFTTTPQEARSTLYATDVAKMIQAPIFHVNADDPEAVVQVARLAFEYRMRFREDVVLDLICYRRHGHNEGDEPSYTNPLLYARIREKIPVRKIYTDKLLSLGVLRPDECERIEDDLQRQLVEALQTIKTRPPSPDEPYEPHGPWTGFSRACPDDEPETAVPVERLAEVAERLAAIPAGFNVHAKLRPLLERRRKSIAENAPIDWALAEALAFGTLLVEGTPVRLSGQDSSRGTFSQRHALLVDQNTGEERAPLDHLSATQARFEVYDSLLSEAAALGFEYGYSLADPSTLVIWEAQFGDFVNGAQVIIDQFVAAAHEKWQRMSGLVMLLPHGFEGQGPEHSSARSERFLQLCANDNIQVVNCTTPAQYFHVLRRQMRRPFRAPLVILTPKSLLRSRRATSPVCEFADGRFAPVLDDQAAARDPGAVRRVLLCSGKIYYELLAAREDRFGDDGGGVAIVRIEQLYPWPAHELSSLTRRYASAELVFWVQEEPANMGAWTFLLGRLQDMLLPGQKLAYAGRPESASPASGSLRVHQREQAALIEAAYANL